MNRTRKDLSYVEPVCKTDRICVFEPLPVVNRAEQLAILSWSAKPPKCEALIS